MSADKRLEYAQLRFHEGENAGRNKVSFFQAIHAQISSEMSVEARILDSLRPIFPQLNDRVLSTCIRNVQETVGSDPATIIPGCIDMLLTGTFNEINLPEERSLAATTPLREEVPVVKTHFVNDDDDVVFISANRGGTIVETPTVIIDDTESPSNARRTVTNPRRNLPFERNTPSTTTTSPPSSDTVEYLQDPVEVQTVSVAADPMKEALENLHSLFPDVDDDYLQSLLDKWSHIPPCQAINNVCNELLEKKDYPRKASTLTTPSATTASPGRPQKEKDYMKDFSSFVSWKYREQCYQLLQNEFRLISVKYIKIALSKFRNHYAPTRRYLQEQLRVSKASCTTTTSTTTSAPQDSSLFPSSVAVTNSNKDDLGVDKPAPIPLLKCGRSPVHKDMFHSALLDEELRREVEFVKKYELSKSEERDRIFALTLNDKQYEEEGQKIECGCCYGDAAFEDMVQCLEGHLFCASCLMNYAKEAAFGQGKAALVCMSDGCDGTFPMSQLRKALPTNILEKYEDRVQEESLSLAQMDDFVQCPSCDFAAILPPEDKVFKCQNPTCAKETCRYCKEEWSEHFGLKCSEVEKSAQKDIRLSYEEKMTMAKIRKCPKCGCEFTKSDGCNKMTCRCGATMCYVCRKPNIGYNHFCQHPKDPGKSCSRCASCSLWTDPSEDDNRAVQELEKEATEAKRKLEAEMVESEDNPAKKVKIG